MYFSVIHLFNCSHPLDSLCANMIHGTADVIFVQTYDDFKAHMYATHGDIWITLARSWSDVVSMHLLETTLCIAAFSLYKPHMFNISQTASSGIVIDIGLIFYLCSFGNSAFYCPFWQYKSHLFYITHTA